MYAFFQGYRNRRALHVLTHSFPTRRSSELLERAFLRRAGGQAELDRNPPLVLVGQKAARKAVKEQDEQCDGERVDRQEQPFAIDDLRSEEHTSELQSLMRNSYAVFCLKKKIPKHYTQIRRTTTTRKT